MIRESFMQAVRDAGSLAKRHVLRASVHVKGKSDFVTDADLAISQALGEAFAHIAPGSRMLSEEADTVEGLQGKLFIVDPVDGTTNLMYGMNLSAISAAYLEDGELHLGAIFNPFTEEFFFAEAGKGATLNCEPIHVNDDATLADALLGVEAGPATMGTQQLFFQQLFALQSQSRGIRWTGSAALDLAYVATGRISACVFHYLYPWDYAAGWLILKEAGGMLTCAQGGKPDLCGRSGMLIASNTRLHPALVDAFA